MEDWDDYDVESTGSFPTHVAKLPGTDRTISVTCTGDVANFTFAAPNPFYGNLPVPEEI